MLARQCQCILLIGDSGDAAGICFAPCIFIQPNKCVFHASPRGRFRGNDFEGPGQIGRQIAGWRSFFFWGWRLWGGGGFAGQRRFFFLGVMRAVARVKGCKARR